MSKQKRKQTAKRHKREKAARSAHKDTAVSPSLAMLIGSVERFAPYLALSDEPDAAVAMARDQLSQAVDAIVAVAQRVDVFDVLETVRLRSSMTDPETFRESEHGATVSMFELLSLILLARGDRSAVPGDAEEPSPEEVLGTLVSSTGFGGDWISWFPGLR